jgi:hypothetical protein
VPKYSSDKQCKSKVERKQAEVPHMIELSLSNVMKGIS